MNAPERIAAAISPASVHEARQRAAVSGRGLYQELEAGCQLGTREFVQAIGRLFGMGVVETAEMFAWKPAFDLLPLPRALQRDCALFVGENGKVFGVVPDPFDTALHDWIEAQAGSQIELFLALRAR